MNKKSTQNNTKATHSCIESPVFQIILVQKNKIQMTQRELWLQSKKCSFNHRSDMDRRLAWASKTTDGRLHFNYSLRAHRQAQALPVNQHKAWAQSSSSRKTSHLGCDISAQHKALALIAALGLLPHLPQQTQLVWTNKQVTGNMKSVLDLFFIIPHAALLKPWYCQVIAFHG